MELSSSAFADQESIPSKYTCDGADISPPLSIGNVPDTAEFLALIVDDPDAPGGTFDHWLLWNIPAQTSQIPEGIKQQEKVNKLSGAAQGQNDFGELGYRGPCPPSGEHRYRFQLYALSGSLELPSSSGKSKLQNTIKSKAVAETQLIGKYGR